MQKLTWPLGSSHPVLLSIQEMAHSLSPANENGGVWTVEGKVEAQYWSVAVGP